MLQNAEENPLKILHKHLLKNEDVNMWVKYALQLLFAFEKPAFD